MTVYRLDVMHAPITDSRLSGKFAPFLILPDNSGTAAGHYTGDAVVDNGQLRARVAISPEMTGLVTLFRKYHFICCLFYHDRSYPKWKTTWDLRLVKIWIIKHDLVPGQECLFFCGTWICKSYLTEETKIELKLHPNLKKRKAGATNHRLRPG